MQQFNSLEKQNIVGTIRLLKAQIDQYQQTIVVLETMMRGGIPIEVEAKANLTRPVASTVKPAKTTSGVKLKKRGRKSKSEKALEQLIATDSEDNDGSDDSQTELTPVRQAR